VETNPITRRLVAIVVADVVGYTRLMEHDEGGTHARLHEIRDQVVDPEIAALGGRIVKTAGDGMLVEFGSAAAALRFAIEVQRAMRARNQPVAPDEQIQFRIGINLGDIIVDGNDIAGDGVNVAARLETLSEPGGICVSAAVRDQIHEDLSVEFTDIGEQHVKNIARPIRVYRVAPRTGAYQQPSRRRWQRLTRVLGWRWLAAGVVALSVAGGAVWLLPQLWNSAPPLTPPTMSLAIAPLSAPPADAAAARFAETFRLDLMAGISQVEHRVTLLSIVADNAANLATAPRELARRVGARYVLEGDVRSRNDVELVNLKLIDTETGVPAWSHQYQLQDGDSSEEASIARRKLIADLARSVTIAERKRVLSLPLDRLNATELVQRGWAVYSEAQSLPNALAARKLMETALRLEPNNARTLVSLADMVDWLNDTDPQTDRDRFAAEMDELTARALLYDPADPRIWSSRSQSLAYLHRWGAALEAIDHTIKLDPYVSEYHAQKAWQMTMTGRPAEALKLFDSDSILKSGTETNAYAKRIQCEAYLLHGEATRAIQVCEKASALEAGDWLIQLFLAAAYANHGDMAGAANAKRAALKAVPEMTIASLRAKQYSDVPEYLKLAETYWYDGLRKAGFPEQ
jgi:class 3 adenylate cyclase/TolB-like protein